MNACRTVKGRGGRVRGASRPSTLAGGSHQQALYLVNIEQKKRLEGKRVLCWKKREDSEKHVEGECEEDAVK